MNRSDLVNVLSYKQPQLLAKDVTVAVKLILDTMSGTLAKGDRIEIRGFGSFELNYRPSRVGRNPKLEPGLKWLLGMCLDLRLGKSYGSGWIGRGIIYGWLWYKKLSSGDVDQCANCLANGVQCR